MIAKRLLDIFGAGVGLLVLLPVLIAIGIAVKCDSAGPAIFRQERVGRGGNLFRIHKFRTMRVPTDSRGPSITVGADSRITRVGKWLRRYKLDELPQLIDVLVGNMSLVGPRPELSRYVAMYPDELRTLVLSVRPGITDCASIEYRHEASVLASRSDPEVAYAQEVLPIKLALCRQYVETRSFWGDVWILLRTAWAVVAR